MHWKKILCKWATIIWLDFLQVWKENCQNFTAVFVCMWFFFSAQLYDAIYKNTFLLLMQLENYFQIQDRKKIKFYVTKLYLSKLFFSNYFLYLTGIHHSFSYIKQTVLFNHVADISSSLFHQMQSQQFPQHWWYWYGSLTHEYVKATWWIHVS